MRGRFTFHHGGKPQGWAPITRGEFPMAAHSEMCHPHCLRISTVVFKRCDAVDDAHFSTCFFPDVLNHAIASSLDCESTAFVREELGGTAIGINQFYVCRAKGIAQMLFHGFPVQPV